VWWSKVCPLEDAVREGLSSLGIHAEIGNALEPLILEKLAQERRYGFTKGESLFHPDHAEIGATPDGLAIDDQHVGLEAKWSSHRDGWTDEEIPDHYMVQVVQCMSVTKRSSWDVGALIAGRWKTYRFHRDLAVEREVLEACRYFWHTHVLREDPPAPGPLDDVRAVLQQRYPVSKGNMLPAGDAAHVLAEDYARALAAEKRAKLEKVSAQHALIALIADADGIEEVATYKAQAGKVSWKAVAEELGRASPESAKRFRELVALHRGEGSRTWRWLQESEESE
jgi:predicted phage-related endonuclease